MRADLGFAWCILLALPACQSSGAVQPAGDADAAVDASVDSDGALALDGAATDDAIDILNDEGARPDGAEPGPPRRVLFIGNSYTATNNLPEVIRQLGAVTPGAALEVAMIAPGGATLRDHWESADVQARIASGDFDVVVLQGQSLEPALSTEDFDFHAYRFAELLAEAELEGVWFATWARRAGDPLYEDIGGDPESLSWELETRYEVAASHNGDAVARVGTAWQIAVAEHPEAVLYATDGSHPAAAGTLLAACVLLQAITGQTPRVPDPPPLGLDGTLTEALCEIAPRVRCDEGMEFCDGSCVQVQWDPAHCGGCDIACEGEDPCRQGVCGCDPGLTGCDLQCVDLLTDASYCGDCDTACSQGSACIDGGCGCEAVSPQSISGEQLAALQPACNSLPQYGSIDCNAAAHAYCDALDCFDSGFGPPSGHAPAVDTVLGVAGDVRHPTWGELAAHVSDCDGSTETAGQACATAIHRYCTASGGATGFGPIAVASDSVTVTCLPAAQLVDTTLEALAPFASRCTADAFTCSVAAWSFCESLGHAGGFGPVEIAGSEARVVCIDR